VARSVFLKFYDYPPSLSLSLSLSVNDESDEEAGGKVGKRGSYRDKSTRKQNGKANVMLGERRWCSK
jgi:hypothetical protein